MKNINALLDNKSDIWSTPKEIYKFYMDIGYFDPCPINPTFNGLDINWQSRNFVNPPYSNLRNWVKKCIEEYEKGNEVLLLVPSRTDTQWFKMLYENNAHFHFIEGRLKFGGSNNPAPFPSMLVRLDKSFNMVDFKYYSKNDMFAIFNIIY